jgi:hypothetical protein
MRSHFESVEGIQRNVMTILKGIFKINCSNDSRHVRDGIWVLSQTVSASKATTLTLATILFILVGFEVLMAASMKMAVFWVVAPCSLVEVY